MATSPFSNGPHNPGGTGRAPLDPGRRRMIHGPIQPMDEPSILASLLRLLRTG